ncbi:phage tail tape measure protein [Streptomyces malaysiensis]
MSAPEIAVAYVSVVPSMRGFAGDVRRQLVGPTTTAGNQAGEGFASNLKTKALAGAAIAGAAVGKALTDALDQANVTRKLQAQLGATGKDADRYGKIAGKLYSKGIVDNFEEGAETIRSVVNAGLVPPDATNKQLESIASKMSDVSKTFGTDMSMQTQAVSALMKNGLAKNAGEALDVITVGMQKLGPNAEDLLETFQEYPVQLKKLGLDSKTSLGLFRQGLQGGARDTDIIADALKEFSIRAIDMSDGSRAAYKALGLDAKEMEKQIGKGGESARKGLDTVLDKLRGIHDPVKREAAAVGLFGTQAEDLGSALFKLDPSKATSAIGKVDGASKKLGKTIHSGPQYQFQVFTRTLRQKFTEAIGNFGIPALMKLIDAARLVAKWLPKAFDWIADVSPWLAPFAILIGGLALALNAQAIAAGISSVATGAWAAVTSAAALVTQGFAGAMALLNAIMSLNPIVLVVIALAALTAAFVVAWKKSDAFRNAVTTAWNSIKNVALTVWNSGLKPAFNAIVTAFKAVGDAATWLWKTVLAPVFHGIDVALRVLATALTIIIGGPIYAAFKLFAFIGQWLWKSALKPAIDAIGAAWDWLYYSIIKPIADLEMAAVRAVGRAATWLWKTAIAPAFRAIGNLARSWWNGLKVIFGWVRDGMRLVGNGAKTLYSAYVKPAFNSIKSTINSAWNSGIKPAFNAIKSGVGKVGDAFNSAKNAIKKAWDKVKGIAKGPVAFVINTVYNKGIVGVWNKVAKAFGAPTLGQYHPDGFATGGILPGYTPGRDVHLAALSGGEAVMRPEWTRAMGPGYIHGMNALARRGGVGAVQKAMGGGLPAFKDGGIFGWVSSAGSALKGLGSSAWDGVKKVTSWLKDGIYASARAGVKKVVEPLIGMIPGTNHGFGKMIKKLPMKAIDALFGYSKKADDKIGSQYAKYAGGGKLGQWIAKAMGITKVPASWAGPLRTLIMRESGGNPNAINLWDSNYRRGDPSRGLMQTIGSTFRAYRLKSLPNNIYDPISNIVAGIRYIKATYGSIFNVQQAVGKTPKGYDSGGWLMPGATQTVNKTGKPEAVFTAEQWSSIHALAARGGGGLQDGARVVLVTRDGEFEAYVDSRADGRIKRTLVEPAQLGRALA